MEHKLHTLASFPIDVIWHENKTTYLSVRKMGGRLFLRLHRLFYDAPTPVLEALLRYCLRRNTKDRAVIKQMAHLYFSRHIREPKPLKSQGTVYHLQEILDRLLAIYNMNPFTIVESRGFGAVQIPSFRPTAVYPLEKICIGWSDRNGCKKFRSITFGTYDQHTRQIRINPILDDLDVPLYFLEFIVYHEMLHALCSSKMDRSGRCSVHTREFREKERLFPHYEQAKKWEKGCLTFFRKRKLHGRP